MADEEGLTALIRAIVQKQEQTTVEELRSLVFSGGELFQRDKDARCQAFASLMRSLIRDRAIQHVIRLARERQQLLTVINGLQEKVRETSQPTSPIAQPILAQMLRTEAEIQGELKQLAKAEENKLTLLDNVGMILESLGCDEKFDLPTVDIRLPKFG